MKIWLLTLLLLLASCQKPPSLYQFTGNAMTMDYRILIGHSLDTQTQRQIEQTILNVFEKIDSVYNKWNPGSELSLINQLEKGNRVPISPQLEEFLQDVDRIVTLSEGKFDPTIETVQKVWKNDPTQIPQNIETLSYIGWHTVHFSDGMFWKDYSETQLDLGGIAKGLCVDLLVDSLCKLGYTDIYVEWGGEIRTCGKHPLGRPWKVFISFFGSLNPDQAIDLVELRDQAIATSGDYLQNWTIGPDTYFHIFDPKSGKPLKASPSRVASASVRGNSCAYVDGLATTAMLFSNLQEAKEWAQKMEKLDPSLTFWLKAKDGSSYITGILNHASSGDP